MASVLIIDDHALFRTGISEVLKARTLDLQIYEAASIREACLLQAIAPNLVLLDIVLNGVNGLDGIKLLQKKWMNSPVLMLSSDQTPLTQQRAKAEGAIGFLHKGSTTEQIILTIEKVLKENFFNQQENSAVATCHKTTMRGAKPIHLTPRQIEVLDLLCTGLSNKLIARRLDCSENTVRGHMQAILQYLNVSTRSEAVFAARRLGLVA